MLIFAKCSPNMLLPPPPTQFLLFLTRFPVTKTANNGAYLPGLGAIDQLLNQANRQVLFIG